MFLHGSRNSLNVGDILVPGESIGKSDNGGHSKHVYIVSTDGYSLTECEEGSYYNNTFEYAVAEALYWGGDKYVYVVEPLAEISYDDTDRYSPASFKTDKAEIVAKYSLEEALSFEGLILMVKGEIDPSEPHPQLIRDLGQK